MRVCVCVIVYVCERAIVDLRQHIRNIACVCARGRADIALAPLTSMCKIRKFH